MFNADASKLVSGGYDRLAFLWDLTNGKQIQEFKGSPPQGSGVQVLFSQDESLLITGNDDGKVVKYNIESGEPIDTLRNITPSMCGGCRSYVDLSDNGKMLISASRRGPVSFLGKWKN